MANYHFEAYAISRGNRKPTRRSVAKRLNYITGLRLHDPYFEETYDRGRSDILDYRIFLPDGSPAEYYDLQHLCDEIEGHEHRTNSQTAMCYTASLPNELSMQEKIRIVEEYAQEFFLPYGLCVIASIHNRGKNDPEQRNPHVHFVVPFRRVGSDGFYGNKDRENNRKERLQELREGWSDIVNQAYERNNCPERVSHLSLEAQGEDREPKKYLPPAELWKLRDQDRSRCYTQEQELNKEKKAPSRDIPSLAEGRSR